MTNIDKEAIRALCRRRDEEGTGVVTLRTEDVLALLAEVERLTAHVAELQADNESLLGQVVDLQDGSEVGRLVAGIARLAAQRDAALALHYTNPEWEPDCITCDGERYPCDTARALGVEE